MMLYHDSRSAHYRAPGGAQACGGRVTIRLRATHDPLSVTLRTWKDGYEARTPMALIEPELYEAALSLPVNAGNLWYYFIVDYGCEIVFYGNARDGLGGEGALYDAEPPSFQMTLFEKGASAPDWARGAIMYQVMVDRFFAPRQPDASRYPEEATFHKSIYEAPDLLLEGGDNQARDFYGGNLEGLSEKLPYLRDLGVTVLYLNPVFMSPSNHKYDTSDYDLIDPAFGTNADFEALCVRAQSHGIRVILDGVFSHTGSDSRYFNKRGRFSDVGAYQSKDSPYYSWYRFDAWPDKYKSWWGFQTLPEVNKADEGFKSYILDIAEKWLKLGASGWRLDVADELPMPFLRALRTRVKRNFPNGALIGEVWEDASNKVAYGEARNYCLGDTLDGVMNYPLRDALLGFMLGKIDAALLARHIESQLENYPPHFAESLMNLLGSHDKPRVLSILSGAEDLEPPREARRATALTDAAYALARKRFIALWTFMTALPGMPCLYYGDEAGMSGMTDPFCRGAYPWGREDKALVQAIADANRARLASAALREGGLKISAPSRDVIVCERRLPNAPGIRYILNRADNSRVIRTKNGEETIEAMKCDCQTLPAHVK